MKTCVMLAGFIWFILVVVLFRSAIGEAQAEQHAQWVSVSCYTNTCITRVLNQLTIERAAEAKLTTWENTTYVWYRK